MPNAKSNAFPRTRGLLPTLLAVSVFAILFGLNYQYPGLFMDSVNPEYLASRILNHAAAQYDHVAIVPGNLIRDRFPILAGSFYHGPLQLYTSLPIYYLLGTDIESARVAQGMYGLAILCISGALFRKSSVPGYLAVSTLLLLAVDPAFSQSFKTQALSTVWPLSLLLASVYLTERWAVSGRTPRAWELVAAGALAGLAFFSYFIYLFFVPALLLHLLLAWRSTPRTGRLWSTGFSYCCGFLIGCIPYFVGFGLLFSRFDDWSSFHDYLTGAANDLQVSAQAVVAIGQKASTLLASLRVATNDNWVSLMIFQQFGATWLGTWKLVLLALVSVAGVFACQRSLASARLSVFFAAAWIGYLVLALPLGARLDGHHLVVLLPCLYLGAAFSTRVLLAREYRAMPQGVASFVLCGALLVLACDAVITQVAFQRRIVQTHGVGAYSAKINELSSAALRRPDDAYAFPDWGFFMPFAFLTHGKVSYGVDPVVSREHVLNSICKGRAFNLVRAGDGWVGPAAVTSLDEKRTGAKGLVPGIEPRTFRYLHEDGSPVFDVHRYELPTDMDPAFCGIHALPRCVLTVAAPGTDLKASPCSMSLCPNTPQRAVRVEWKSTDSSIAATEIWVGSNAESRKQLWLAGEGSGSATTGPWSAPGSTFELRQSGSGKVLASLTLGGLECRATR